MIAIEAKAAIWIVADPRPEHIRVISRLIELPLAACYLLKLQAVRIGDSPPAPLLTLIVGSSEESQEVGEAKKELTERYLLRQQFWASLLERAKDKTSLHANISPGQYSYIQAGTGKRGLTLRYIIQKHTSDIDLYIDRGTDADNTNEEIFDKLEEFKEKIQEDFGEQLEWQRLEDKRACRISKRFSLGGYRDDEERWPEIQDAMIDG